MTPHPSIESSERARPDLGSSVEELKHDARKVAHDISGLAGDAAQTGIETVRSGASKAAESGQQAIDATKRGLDRVCETIAAHPTASVLVAIGIGAIVGRMLPRR